MVRRNANVNFNEWSKNALQAVERGDNVFITGGAGTGKSFLISEITKRLTQQGLRVAVTASTWVAADIIGGITIHSLLHWRPSMPAIMSRELNLKELREYDVVIVDEVSMINADLFYDLVNCYAERKKENNIFQLIFSGDFLQLPPVKKTEYVFELYAWNYLQLKVCFLDEVKRQDESAFIENLNAIRLGEKECLDYFCDNSAEEPIENAICICGRNDTVERINRERLGQLSGDENVFTTNVNSKIKGWEESRFEKELHMKCGARVMLTRNTQDYHNGALGTVAKITDDCIFVRLDKDSKTVGVRRVKYYLNNEGMQEVIEQFPIKLAFAITVHKSQGHTFDSANIYAEEFWLPGHLYVALSRVRSIKGVYFASKPKCAMASQKVLLWYEQQKLTFLTTAI